MTRKRLVTEDVEEAVVEAYGRGDKLLDIEQRHGIARATVYWILEKHGVSPSRIKPSARSAGTKSEMAHLYAIIEAQDTYIKQLEQMLREEGIEPPEMA